MPDNYGLPSWDDAAGSMPTWDSVVGSVPTWTGPIPSMSSYMQQIQDQRQAAVTPTPTPTPAQAAPAKPAEPIPFMDWPTYLKMRSGVDPAQAYNEYIKGVAPNQLAAAGQTPDQIKQTLALFQQQTPQPASVPQEGTVFGNLGKAASQELGTEARNVNAAVELSKAAAEGGDLTGVGKLAKEKVLAQGQVPASQARFRELLSQPTSGVLDWGAKVANAIKAEPEGALDSTLQFAIGTLTQWIAPEIVGNLMAPVAGIAAPAAVMGVDKYGELGIEKLLDQAKKDGIDPLGSKYNDWLKTKGFKDVFGDAAAGGITDAMSIAVAIATSRFLGTAAGKALGESAEATGATVNPLLNKARALKAAELGAGAGGFAASGALTDLAAGNDVNEDSMFANALMYLIPGLHGVGKFVKGESHEVPQTTPATETKAATAAPGAKADLTEEELTNIGKEAIPEQKPAATEAAAKAPEAKPEPVTQEQIDAIKSFDEATPEERIQKVMDTLDEARTNQAAHDRVLEEVTALHVAHSIWNEVVDGHIEEVANQARTEAAQRQAERAKAPDTATATLEPPGEPGTTGELPGANEPAISPLAATAGVPPIRRGSFTRERGAELAGNGTILQRLGAEAEGGPAGGRDTGVNEEVLHPAATPESGGNQPAGSVGRGGAEPAAESKLPVVNAGGEESGRTVKGQAARSAEGTVTTFPTKEEAKNPLYRKASPEEQAKLKRDFEEALRKEADGEDLNAVGTTDHVTLPEGIGRDLDAGTATADRALGVLAKGSDSPLTRVLAHALRMALRGVDIPIEYRSGMVTKKGEAVAGKFIRDANGLHIYLDPESGKNAATLMHELVHAATAHVIDNPLNDVQRTAVADLNRMLERAKTLTLDEQYGFKDLKEFVAEAMTNRQFQERLAKVNWEGLGPKQTLWQKFKDVIARTISSLFPGREKSVLYNAILRSVDLFDAPKLEGKKEELNQEEPKEHNVIKGVDENGIRRAVAYRRGENDYTHYPVNETYPKGIPGEGTKNLTREQLRTKFSEEGHRPILGNASEFNVEPSTIKKAVAGYKDGVLKFAATQVKGEDGKPTGKWNIVEGTDLEDKTVPRTNRVVDDYNDVVKARAEQELGPTRRTSVGMARAADLENRPEVKLVLPSKFNLTMANREAPSIYAGTQIARAGLKEGRAVPASMRPDIENTLKISRTEHDTEKLDHDQIKPLQKTGRVLASKWKKNEEQINQDITDLVYDHRADVLLSDARYQDVPELEAQVRQQQIETKARLAQLPAAYKTELDSYLRQWKKVSDSLQDYKAKAGLIDQAEADRVKNRYELYVPMRTDFKSTQGKQATGASAESTHPLRRIISDWHKAIQENYQNQELQATYRMAEAHNLPLPDGKQLFELSPITEYRYDDEGNIHLGVKNQTLDPDSVRVMFDGKPYSMKINDPDYRDALKYVPPNDKLQAINSTMRGMAMYNAISGGLKTAASPLFALKNLRDIQTAFAQTDERTSRTEIAKSLVNPQVWKAAIQNAIEPWTGTRGSKFNEDARNAYISRRGQAGLESQIERPTLTLAPTPLQRAGELRKNLFSFEHGKISGLLTFATKTGENLVRGAVFDASMNSPKLWDSVGRSNGTDAATVRTALNKYSAKQPLTAMEQDLVDHMHSEAASIAKNSTVNFEPKGRLSGPMNAFWLFANAKTQGARTYAERMGLTGIRGGENWRERLARGNPYTQAATAIGTGLGIASAMYLYQNDKDYPFMSDYSKDDYFTFGSGKFSIPLAPELFWGYIMGQAFVDAKMNTRWADPEMRRAKAATRFGTGLLQTFWPAGSSMSDPVGGAQGITSQYWQRMLLPTAAQEFVVAPSNNVNTFGSPIVTGLNDKGVPQSGKPIYAHNAEKVSPLAASMASGLHKAGAMDVAPQMLQYYVNQLGKSQIDLVHAIAPNWEFFNSIFGAPAKTPGGEEQPSSFERTFFQKASPLAIKNDIEEIRQHEVAKAFDRGEDPKKSPLVKMLKKGEDASSKVFNGYDKMTPEQRQRASDKADKIRQNTLKRYEQQIQPQE